MAGLLLRFCVRMLRVLMLFLFVHAHASDGSVGPTGKFLSPKQELQSSMTTHNGPIAVIGAGFSGLAAALELRHMGYEVTLYEQADHVGGRGYAWSANGYTFDAGPSWYWMPEIFEQIFTKHGRKASDYYNLTRLDPAYTVYFEKGTRTDVPGTFPEFLAWAETADPQAKNCIHSYFENAGLMYEKGIGEWIWKPMVSLSEFFDWELIRSALTMNMFGSLEKDILKCVQNPLVQQVLKWPVIFLGASPKEAPAMYSLMTYAGHAKGTWYPDGGMSAPGKALAKMAEEEGVKIKLQSPVDRLDIKNGKVDKVCVHGACDAVGGVVASVDYHHLETHLLPPEYRRYREEFWDNQVMSPSVLLYYLGVDKALPLEHHTFFFDDKLDQTLKTTIEEHTFDTSDPVFYVTSTSKVDPSTAPASGSALFILVPIPYTMNGTDTQELRDRVYASVIRRMEADIGQFHDSIVYKRDFGPSDFEKEFGAFRGNAFGHANLLEQSLIFKPSMESLVQNMVFAGHLTNPGPGVPPAIASGTTAAHLLDTKLNPGTSLLFFLNCLAFFLVLCRLAVSTKMARSRHACMKLLYNHGRTFFAGASLMKLQQFLDTAALYGLLRIADDCVDDVDDHESRRKRLDDFEGKFWSAWASQDVDCYDKHPVLPAVIEVSNRLKFPREFFEEFFRAMRSDVQVNIVRNWADAYKYMEGSAAIVGDFMLPILMPDSSQQERDEALPYAKDLGRAFQLTNFCRDIDEDIDIQRQYIPEELCRKHGVDIWRRTEQQAGFRELIEEIFSECDKLYVSGDKGIALLPERVRPVVLVASRLYQQIQTEVRKRKYNVFSERVHVSTKHKIKIALEEISFGLTAKMIVAELLLLTIFFLDDVTIPFVTLLLSYQLCDVFAWPGMTYYGFHCLLTIPQLVIMYNYAKSRAESPEYFQIACKWTLILCAVATVYTTPWDNFLVKTGIWGYGSTKNTLGVIGYVPIEEYAFFSIETALVCMTWVAHARCSIIPHFRRPSSSRTKGLVFFALIFLLGVYLLQFERGRYMGLITVWAIPVLAGQWNYGADALMAQKNTWLFPLLYSWLYLCIIDRWAIRSGIWSINPAKTAPLIDWLPLEEAYFFACTGTMCTWGLQLAMNVCTLDCPLPIAYRRVYLWCRKVNYTPTDVPWTHAIKHTVLYAMGLSAMAMVVVAILETSLVIVLLILVGLAATCGVLGSRPGTKCGNFISGHKKV